jgi:hypothetical protein
MEASLPSFREFTTRPMKHQPKIQGIICVLPSILIDTQLWKYYQPTFPSLSPSTEQFDLREMNDMDFYAHDTDASQSDYEGKSSDYIFGHSSPDIESPAGSPVAFTALMFHVPSIALRVVDAGANINVEVNHFAIIAGIYTRLRNPIHVKGIDFDIHGCGLVDSTLPTKMDSLVTFAFGPPMRPACQGAEPQALSLRSISENIII